MFDDSDEPDDAFCWVCDLPIEDGQEIQHMKDSDGLVWPIHRTCVESEMEFVDSEEDDEDYFDEDDDIEDNE